MRYVGIVLVLVCAMSTLWAEENSGEPTNQKAQKTYREAVEHAQHHITRDALDSFKKADKQDGGHCVACQMRMIHYGVQLREWKTAETAATELVAGAQSATDTAIAHYEFGMVLLNQGMDKHKDELFSRAHDEMTRALTSAPNFPDAVFADGRTLALLKQDSAAKAEFEQYVKMKSPDALNRQRALRYITQPELARARMAPPFEVTTMDGQHISLDSLHGKVVLVDFWATWCGPCREALPHIRKVVRKFQDEPLVVLSVSLDEDEDKWKDFIGKNEMTWLQCHDDGGFAGPMARLFNVEAIPHTFTIDADGVLQDERIGDASIEGNLKKLLARVRELQAAGKPSQ